MTTPVAVLWDMDGTLVDTEPYWIETEFELAAEHGATWSREQALALVGHDLLSSAHDIREQMGLDLTPEAIVERLLDGVVARVQDEVPWCPGARELLSDLYAAGVPCALVTMSWTRFVAPILAVLPPDTFAAVVTGDEVEHGKPHPEPYLTAARMLGVAPGTAWRSRTPRPARARPRRPGARCSWCPTTSRSRRVRDGSSAQV